ncbi:MAG: serine hydrolase domain-containing protein [Bacillota bacterium]|nr:serine hydrolase domain-containing protein [Bacillota bacterium]HOP71335.1 serine hydrolase domain-containing protein [Bacillota bacterium]HPT36271.1 serine hydrolase domain-containing protein [Bacillota bacterium]HPZ85972.1 serine hydrolase domain-containing protein [Bacillota bacterium]HQD86319.1 serine hydrolase domain-containing protein [Bacillota bacterium]
MKHINWGPLEGYIEQMMEKHHIVGAAVAVADRQRVIYAKGFGVRDLETRDLVTPETIFGCASVSKSFTAMAIMQLAGQGMLSVDDPVIRHLPEFRLAGMEDMSAVTIRHLLSHTTGLPPMKRREEIIDLEEHLEYIASAEYELLGPPGEYFSYCNDTFLLNGLIIQRKSGQLYRRYMTQHILDAAGMHRSTYNLEELPKMGNVSTPYSYNRKTHTHDKQAWPTLGTYEVGGGVRSCVLDLMKYGQIYLNEGKTHDGKQIAPAHGLREMWNSPMYAIDRSTYYHLGLKVTPNYAGTGVTLVEHSGGQPGVSSNFGFVPEKGITAAVLTNVDGVPAGAIWLAAVNTVLGLPLDTQRSVEVDCGASPEELAKFAGFYECDEGGKVDLYMDGDILKLRMEDLEFEVKASDHRTLFYDDMGQQRVLRFYFREEASKPWAVLAGSRMLRRKQ